MDSHEEWREIEESGGKYSVSNLGRVRNNEIMHIMSPVKLPNGYVKVKLRIGREWTVTVHRLVAKTFIPNPENKPEVNHINGIHDDNRVENLEWVTGEENRDHAKRIGLVKVANPYKQGYLYRAWENHRKHNNLCEEWKSLEVFCQWAERTGYHDGLYLHRIDVHQPASPTNCCWKTEVQYIPNADIRQLKLR